MITRRKQWRGAGPLSRDRGGGPSGDVTAGVSRGRDLWIVTEARQSDGDVILGGTCEGTVSVVLRQLGLPRRGVWALTSSELPRAVPDGPT